uniref:RNA recognition motif-containing protein n=1 Tax=Toxoplasma gondii TgCATBr9 TaxID=943120 RepID=A0A2T6J2X8_TOXGO|nr:RNA recognition motif-containing protein [Toxoplasma gondii TgCATBr9]
MYHIPVAAPLGVYGTPAVPVPYSPAPYGAPAHPGAYPRGAVEAWEPGVDPRADRRSEATRDVRRTSRAPISATGRDRGDLRSGSHAAANAQSEENKIFVGNLNQQTTTETLSAYMKQFGAVEDVVVMVDKVTGNSRGFGFVTFADASSVTSCVGAEKHVIDGQEVDVRNAVPKGQMVNKNADDDQHSKVFVGGIPETLTEERLSAFLSERFGSVKKVSLMHDKNTGRCRGFGFVTFQFPHSAQNCVGKHDVDGHVIEVKKAEPRFATAKPLLGDERRGEDRLRGREDNGYDRPHAGLYGAPPDIDLYGAGPMRRGHYPTLRPATRADYDGYAGRPYVPPSDPYAAAPVAHYPPVATTPVAATVPAYSLPPATAPGPYMASPSSPTSLHPASVGAVYQQVYPAHSVAPEQAPGESYGQYAAAGAATPAGDAVVDPYDIRSAASRQARYARPPASRVHPY